MKNYPIIKRYVKSGWRVLAGNFKFSEALNFLCRVGLALRGVANRVGGVFCFVFLKLRSIESRKANSLRLDKKYLTPFKAGRGEAELAIEHKDSIPFHKRTLPEELWYLFSADSD